MPQWQPQTAEPTHGTVTKDTEQRQPLWSKEIENTRWVSFEIKCTRQGFENACWHREACRAIQHAFSKPSLVNLISKDANLVFYLSVTLFKLAIMTYFYFISVLIQRHWRRHLKSATSSWPDKGNMPWDRKRLLGYAETIQLILGVTDKASFSIFKEERSRGIKLQNKSPMQNHNQWEQRHWTLLPITRHFSDL